jgi:hypothetical protein
MFRLPNNHLLVMLRHLIWVAALLLIICFVPHADENGRKAFHELILSSTWGDIGEWSAAWASVVVILLALGLFYFIRSVDESLPLLRREHFSAEVFLGLMVSPTLLLIGGVYLLTKALF